MRNSGKVEGPVWFSRIASVPTVVGILSEAPTYLDEAAPFYPILQTNYEFNKILLPSHVEQYEEKFLIFVNEQ